MSKIYIYTILFINIGLVLIFSACSMETQNMPIGVKRALKKAGENRVELERVIGYYKEIQDTLKLYAAYFLIENMPGKYALLPKHENDRYKSALHSLPDDPTAWHPSLSKVYQHFDSISLIQKIPEKHKVYDLDVITADFLIENIDLAFEAWELYKNSSSYTFEDFCNYVLPYRDGNEPLDNWRKDGFYRFGFILDSLSDPVDIAKYIIPNLNLTYNAGMTKYPYMLSFEEIKNIRIGSCEHLSFYLTQSLRAIGIPTATEIIPVWANRSSGHRWNVVKDTTGRFVDVGFGPDAINEVAYKVSKIYRQVYQIQQNNTDNQQKKWFIPDLPNRKDVTSEYDMALSNVSIKPDKKKRTAYLCTFNNANWIPVAKNIENHRCYFFKSLGTGKLFGKNKIDGYENEGKGIVYLPMTISVSHLSAIAPPFILKENGELKYLKPNHSQKRSVKLYRKYPKYDQIAGYAKDMKGGYFECSNTPDFSEKEVVHFITETPSKTITEVTVTPSAAYRYMRYVAPDSFLINIGELSFFTVSGKVEGLPFASEKVPDEDLMKVFDNNIETYYEGKVSGDFIGIDFNDKIVIDKICYTPRTDNNDIFPGDKYELFYWEDTWKSMGIKSAKENWLTYDNVPENALLLLRNHTCGKEERIFTYENDIQVWW